MKFYALAVCFATLLCGAITFGFLVFNVVKIASPELTMHPGSLGMYQSVESYRSSQAASSSAVAMAQAMAAGGVPSSISQSPVSELSDEEIEQILLKQESTMLESHRFRAKQSMLLQAIILSICAALYFVHWRLALKFGAGRDA